jgi:hypothetical protein
MMAALRRGGEYAGKVFEAIFREWCPLPEDGVETP